MLRDILTTLQCSFMSTKLLLLSLSELPLLKVQKYMCRELGKEKSNLLALLMTAFTIQRNYHCTALCTLCAGSELDGVGLVITDPPATSTDIFLIFFLQLFSLKNIVTCDRLQMKCNMWHLTHGTWHMAHNTWQVMNIVKEWQKQQYGPIIYFKAISTKTKNCIVNCSCIISSYSK